MAWQGNVVEAGKEAGGGLWIGNVSKDQPKKLKGPVLCFCYALGREVDCRKSTGGGGSGLHLGCAIVLRHSVLFCIVCGALL